MEDIHQIQYIICDLWLLFLKILYEVNAVFYAAEEDDNDY